MKIYVRNARLYYIYMMYMYASSKSQMKAANALIITSLQKPPTRRPVGESGKPMS